MKNSDNAIITSSRNFSASQMTEILRSLELLITSRYHAAVLSLENIVPQIAVGHDPRLKGLYKDLKIDENYLIDYLSEKNADSSSGTIYQKKWMIFLKILKKSMKNWIKDISNIYRDQRKIKTSLRIF